MNILVGILLIIVIIEGVLISNLINRCKSILQYSRYLEELCAFKDKFFEGEYKE